MPVPINMESLGAGLAMLISGAAGWLGGRSSRKVHDSAANAQASVFDLLSAEIQRLSHRLSAMEGREGRLIRHVFKLEALMRVANLEPPQFDFADDIYHEHIS